MGHFLEWFILKVLASLFPKRYRIIPNAITGEPLLRQFKVTNWAYLQSFAGPEDHNWFHVHRWRKMYSFVLSGWFREERYPGFVYIEHKAPSFYSMGQEVIHRIQAVGKKSWTLFIMIDNQVDWGYYKRPKTKDLGYVSFDKMIPADRRVKSL
jgi:hypothetical protein